MIKKLMAAVLTVAGQCSSCGACDIPSVNPDEFQKEIQADSTACVLDVRTPEEFAAGHIHSAINLDVKNETEFRSDIAGLDKNLHYFVYCRSGRRSMQACEIMKQQGFDVTDLKGGIIAWEKESLPVVR